MKRIRLSLPILLLTLLVLSPAPLAFGAIPYQECIPNGVGSTTELSSSFGEPNWFAVSSESKDVMVYKGGFVGQNRNLAGITIDENGNLVIDPQAPSLGWIITEIITVPLGSYELYGGVLIDRDGSPYITQTRAVFSDYVYGSGDDLYLAENTPQSPMEQYGFLAVEKITVMATAYGKVKFLTRINNRTFISPTTNANGSVSYNINMNPVTNNAWKFSELDNLEMGVRLNDAILYWIKILIKFNTP